MKPEVLEVINSPSKNDLITEEQFDDFLDALSRGASHETASRYVGHSTDGMRRYTDRDQSRIERVRRARADWTMAHLDRLNKADDDGSGASARVRASLGALASVDKRYRKDVHVGGTVVNNNTLVLADPRPTGLIGNPDRYALADSGSQPPVVVEATPAAEEIAPAPASPPISPKKGTPIL